MHLGRLEGVEGASHHLPEITDQDLEVLGQIGEDVDNANPLQMQTDAHTVKRQKGSSFSRLLAQPSVEGLPSSQADFHL